MFTAIRDLATDDLDACPNGEYDCDDATCISDDLICNSVRYCKHRQLCFLLGLLNLNVLKKAGMWGVAGVCNF